MTAKVGICRSHSGDIRRSPPKHRARERLLLPCSKLSGRAVHYKLVCYLSAARACAMHLHTQQGAIFRNNTKMPQIFFQIRLLTRKL